MLLDHASSLVMESPLVKRLTSDQLVQLLLAAEVRHYPAGKVIYRIGDASDGSFCVVTLGKVSIRSFHVDQPDKELGRGTLLGEIAALRPQAERTATVVAADGGAEVIMWNRRTIPENLFAVLQPIMEDEAWARLTSDLG